MGDEVFVYIIDTSSIIDLFRLYPQDIFPELWKKLDELIKNNRLVSHRFVFEELQKKSDEACKWAKERKGMFREVTQQQIEKVKGILAKYPQLVDVESEIVADPWLIALALEKEEQQKLFKEVKIVVIEEKIKPNKINIPFVCRELGIECINIIGLMRKEGWKW
jgi:hypothetical protein